MDKSEHEDARRHSYSRLQRLLASPPITSAYAILSAYFCLVLLMLLSPASAQNVPNADLLHMKGDFLKRVNADKAAITRNQGLLAQAQAAHQHATADNDAVGISVTVQAIDTAQQALDRATRNLADDQQRLAAANQALLLWHSVWDSIGPRALATIHRGTITIDTPLGPKPFDPYEPVRPGEHIRLGPDAFLELQLGNGSEMHLGPGTDFEYERDVQGVQWEVFKGELHKITAITAVRGSNDDVRYRGIISIAAVRGTDFTLATDGQQDTYTVLEGEIEVDPGGGRPKVTLTAGQQLIVPKTGVVGPVKTIDPQTIRKWWDQ